MINLAAILFFAFFGFGPVDEDVLISEKTDQYMNAHVATGNYNGVVLIARDGNVIKKAGYGMYDLALGVEVSPEHKFQLGSIEKSFTGVSALILQEKKLLNVNDTVDSYLPDFPNGDKIKILHLLTHSSGLAEFDFALVFKSLDEIIADFKDKPLSFEPGSKSEYCTSGFILLRKIIEKVTGISHQEFIKQEILEKLGMDNSGFLRGAEIVKYLGRGYFNGEDGLQYPQYDEMLGQGSLYSTADDLFTFIKGVNSNTLLSKDLRELLFKPQIMAEGITSPGHSFALGWAVDQQHGHLRIWHNGHIFGFSAIISFFSDKNIQIIVLSNVQNNSPVEKISEDLAAIILGKEYKLPVVRQAVEIEPAELDKLVGKYQYSEDFIVEVYREGDKLYLQGTGQPRFRLFPESETLFFLKGADVQIDFEFDDDSHCTGLVIHQYGKKMPVPRIK